LGLVEPVTYPGAGQDIPLIRAPITLSASAKRIAAQAPQLGEHSAAILAEIGYSADAISALRAQRII
jgi:crotonobetainyl-CoA:carnitine CoA-transferase CaiB-like acyl-CoA transferase